MPRRRSKAPLVIALLIPIAAIVWGVYMVTTTTASCGGQTQHAGQTCVETKYGIPDGVRKSASQTIADQHETGWVAIAAGIGIIVLSGVRVLMMAKAARSGPRPGVQAPPAGYGAPAQQPYGQPGYAQQPGPGYAPQPDPGYAQQPNPAYAPQADPAYGQQQGWYQQQYPQQGPYPQR